MVIADIDDFRLQNDRFGHSYGDKILTCLAQTLTKAMRPSDIIARYGGEEFSLLFPNTSENEVLVMTEQLRSEIERATFTGQRGPVSMSFGLATVTTNRYPNVELFLKAAEDHMYAAKRLGKNRVCGE